LYDRQRGFSIVDYICSGNNAHLQAVRFMSTSSEIDIYNLLNKVAVQDATLTQLNSATGRTIVDRKSIEFWQGVITVAQTMKQTRTNLGLPITETACVFAAPVGDGVSVEAGPSTGTGIWRVQSFQQNALTITQNGVPLSINAGGYLQFPIYVTKLSPLVCANASGGALNAVIQYNEVSL
jgi:hypothetical protein